MIFKIMRFVVLLSIIGEPCHGTNKEKDHQSLTALMQKVTDLINKNEIEELETLLDPNAFTMVSPESHIYTSIQDFSRYWANKIGEKTGIVKIITDPKPVSHTRFIKDDVGTCVGTCDHHYHMADGQVKSIRTIWTMVLKKTNNQWRIASAHISPMPCEDKEENNGFFNKILGSFLNLFSQKSSDDTMIKEKA